MQAPSEVSRAGIADHPVASLADLVVAGERPGPADVALAGAGGVRRQRGRDAVGADQEVGHVGGGGRGQRRPAGSGTGSSGSTSSTVGAQSIQTVRSVGSSIALSSALQACSVSRSASSTIEDLPAPADRRERGAADQVADLVDADGELLGADHGDVGVGAVEHGAARVALAAARSLARTGARRRTRPRRWSGRTRAGR